MEKITKITVTKENLEVLKFLVRREIDDYTGYDMPNSQRYKDMLNSAYLSLRKKRWTK